MLESPILNNFITSYPVSGSNEVTQKMTKSCIGFEDVIHYQKMIVALTETDRLMKKIDEVKFMEKE